MAIRRVVMPRDTPSGLGWRLRRRVLADLYDEPPPRTVRGSSLDPLRRLLGLPPVWFDADRIGRRVPRRPAGDGGGATSREPRRPRRPSPALSAQAEPPEDLPGVDAVAHEP